MPHHRSRRGIALALGFVLLAGCTADGPDLPAQDAFVDGACREAAPDVLEISRRVAALGEGPALPAADKDALREAQGRIRVVAETAPPVERADLDGLVQAVGLLRLRADGNTYDPSLADAVAVARDRVLQRCTGSTDTS